MVLLWKLVVVAITASHHHHHTHGRCLQSTFFHWLCACKSREQLTSYTSMVSQEERTPHAPFHHIWSFPIPQFTLNKHWHTSRLGFDRTALWVIAQPARNIILFALQPLWTRETQPLIPGNRRTTSRPRRRLNFSPPSPGSTWTRRSSSRPFCLGIQRKTPRLMVNRQR